MRPLIAVALLVGVASCNGSASTAPDVSVISIRVLDDAGARAGRHRVLVTLPTATLLDTRTQYDGTVDIDVADAGVYLVRIVPRAGYVSSPLLSKRITIASPGKVVVDFTVHRDGLSRIPCNGELPDSTTNC